MTNEQLNERIHELDGWDMVDKPIMYFGWYWRDVDFAADYCTLAVLPSNEPSWHQHTIEAMMGQPHKGGGTVGFCENNKWGYTEFKVEGTAWRKLVDLVRSFVQRPTKQGHEELVAYMNSLAPVGAADLPI